MMALTLIPAATRASSSRLAGPGFSRKYAARLSAMNLWHQQAASFAGNRRSGDEIYHACKHVATIARAANRPYGSKVTDDCRRLGGEVRVKRSRRPLYKSRWP